MIFISIPKTGTQSFLGSLPFPEFQGGVPNRNHYSAKRRMELGDFDTGMTSFAILRDPIERLQSWFYWHKEMYAYDNVYDFSMYDCDFSQWVMDGCRHHWSVSLMNDCGISNPLNQYEFVCNEEGDEILVDYIFLYQNISSAYEFACKELGVPLQPLPYIGRSSRSERKEVLSEEVLNRINTMFETDINLFNLFNSFEY